MADRLVNCPVCDGNGSYTALVMRSGVCGEEEVSCSTCKGTGAVDREYMARLAEGRRMSAERMAAGVSLRERAAELGISVVELSDIEHGRRAASTDKGEEPKHE